MQAAVDAHSRDDRVGEARALTVLGQVLCEAGRWAEASSAHEQALAITLSPDECRAVADVLIGRGEVLARLEAQEPALVNAQAAFNQASRVLRTLGPVGAAAAGHAAQRSSDLQERRWVFDVNTPPRNPAPAQPALYQEVALGFVAVKLLGPFLEAFAAKLGEQLGESTARALGRITLFGRSRRQAGVPIRGEHLTVALHGGAVTTLVLPAALTDEAKEAFIDLDVTASEIRGETLHWDAAAGAWRPVGPAVPDDHRPRAIRPVADEPFTLEALTRKRRWFKRRNF